MSTPTRTACLHGKEPTALSVAWSIAITLLALVAATQTAFAQAAPKTVVAEAVLDFGTISRGEVVEGEFVIENQGTAPLEIREVRSPCSCTVVDYDSSIAAGQKGYVRIELDSATLVGPTTKRVHVFTNDSNAPRIDLAIKAISQPYVDASPGFIRYIVVQGFDDVANDSLLKQTVYGRGGDFKITGARSDLDFVTVSYREAEPEERLDQVPGSQWILETRISPDAKVGALAGYVTLDVDHPKQRTLPIPISGFVRPVFAVTPSNAVYRDPITLNPDEPNRATFKVRNFATENITLEEVKLEIAGIDATYEVETEGRIYWVILEFQADMPPGPFEGTLQIKTSSERAPVIEVPVSGVIAGS